MNQNEMEEIKRHFGVVAEGLRNEIRQVAEGVINLNEKFDREISAFRHEVKEEFKEVRALIKFSYAELDQRIRLLEDGFHGLKTRLERLEARP